VRQQLLCWAALLCFALGRILLWGEYRHWRTLPELIVFTSHISGALCELFPELSLLLPLPQHAFAAAMSVGLQSKKLSATPGATRNRQRTRRIRWYQR
jgi:hypothetical protein